MFCNACGTAMSAEQRFCAACGKQIGVAPVSAGLPLGGAGEGRVAKHLEIVAWLWIAIAFLTLPVAIIFIAIGSFPYERFLPNDSIPAGLPALFAVFHLLFLSLGIVFLVITAVHFLAAWGLFHHAPWARILTIAFAFLRILEIPLGTALAIYTIWVLMGPTSEQEYRALRPA
jgi:hypothetical protein